jgi:hypothetical protein
MPSSLAISQKLTSPKTRVAYLAVDRVSSLDVGVTKNTAIVSAYVERDLRAALIARAAESNRTLSTEIREALTQYVQREAKETQ